MTNIFFYTVIILFVIVLLNFFNKKIDETVIIHNNNIDNNFLIKFNNILKSKDIKYETKDILLSSIYFNNIQHIKTLSNDNNKDFFHKYYYNLIKKEKINFSLYKGSTTIFKLIHPQNKDAIFILTNTISVKKYGYYLNLLFMIYLYHYLSISSIFINLRGHDINLEDDLTYLVSPVDDILEILWLRNRNILLQYKKRVLLGTSMGALLFATFLGRFEKILKNIDGSPLFDLFISVSNPFSILDLSKGEQHKNGAFDTIYNNLLATNFYYYLSAYTISNSVSNYLKINNINNITTSNIFREDIFLQYYKNLISSKLTKYYFINNNGLLETKFYDLDKDIRLSEYESNISSKYYLETIKTPSIYIHALNDFITPITFSNIESIKKNKNNLLILTRNGYHVGYHSDNGDNFIMILLKEIILIIKDDNVNLV